VDDPLLRRRHGFLRYDALLDASEGSNFAASLAFIPWNYKRSDPQVADLFRRHPGRLSLSIHGCDHTEGEFGGADEEILGLKARTAKRRMARHTDLTGIPCDNVMVFPQGVFSSTALKALKGANYLAAVNSTPYSVDTLPQPMRVRDLLTPAVMCYADFPLFIRHYPDCIAEFALDLFLGKPALVVVHHDYFEHGYEKIQDFARQINRLSEGLKWCGLEAVVRQACLRRRAEDNAIQLQSYTIQGALETALEATFHDGLASGGLPHRARVFARRHACEFRDNFVCRSHLLMKSLRVANRLRKML
jgi:hypothetical protein